MNENELIQSIQYNLKKLLAIFIIIGAVISLFVFFVGDGFSCLGDYIDERKDALEEYTAHFTSDKHINGKCKDSIFIEYKDICMYESKKVYINLMTKEYKNDCKYYTTLSLIPFYCSCIIGLFIFFLLYYCNITITDKRVYGKTLFGKRVDLPLDSVSSVSFSSLIKGISISTASGHIKFFPIKNCNEIYEKINELLIERQELKNENNINKFDATEELRKCKKLLDDGIITQEEFNKKKESLLK